MAAPSLDVVLDGLERSARKRLAEGAAARADLLRAAGTAEDRLVRLVIAPGGGLVDVQFLPAVSTATPPAWSASMLTTYADARARIAPLPPQPERLRDPVAPHQDLGRPRATQRDSGRRRSDAVARSPQLDAELSELRCSGRSGGVVITLAGAGALVAADVTTEALRSGQEGLATAVRAAWSVAAADLDATIRASLTGPVVST